MLTARCLRNFSTDTGHPHQNGMHFPNMISLLNERRDGNFGLLRLSKAFKFATQTEHVEHVRYADSVRNCCRHVAHQYQLVLNLEAARSSASWFSRAAPALADEMLCWSRLLM